MGVALYSDLHIEALADEYLPEPRPQSRALSEIKSS